MELSLSLQNNKINQLSPGDSGMIHEFHSGHIVRDDTVIFSGVPFVILYFCNSPHSTPLTLNGHPLDDPHWPRGAPPRLVFLHPGLFSVLAEHAWILNFRSNKRKQSAFAKMVGPYWNRWAKKTMARLDIIKFARARLLNICLLFGRFDFFIPCPNSHGRIIKAASCF